MSKSKNVWFRLGYALERARSSPVQKRLASLAERHERKAPSLSERLRPHRNGKGKEQTGTIQRLVDSLTARQAAREERSDPLTPMLESLGVAALSRVVIRKPVTFGVMTRGTLVGIGAETVRLVVRRLRSGTGTDAEISDDLLRGAANGLVYGSLLAPLVPGAALSKGLIYGAASFLASGAGGLPELLGTLSPHRKLPGMSRIVKPEGDDEDVLDHLVFGLALAALYESSRASSGTRSLD